jgi:hypothetical protein
VTALPRKEISFGNNGYLHLAIYGDYTQDIINNTSTVDVGLDFMHNYDLSAPATQTGSITVGGSTGTGSYTLNGASGVWKRLVTTRTVVAHEADGKKKVNISGSAPIKITWNGSWIDTASISMGDVVLTTIPRATTPTFNASSVALGSSVTISTSRASTAFTHDLSYSAAGKTGSIATGVATSISWNLPVEILAPAIKALSAVCTVTCVTKNGSTVIGTKTNTFTITVPDNDTYKPAISAMSVTEAGTLPTDFASLYVQTMSKLKIVTTAAGGEGVSISTYAVTVNENGARTQTLTGADVTSLEILGSGVMTITVTVTDERGRTRTKTYKELNNNKDLTVLPYAPPKITSLSCFRASDTAGTPKDDGTYLAAKIEASVSSVKNGSTEKNRLALVLKTRPAGTTSWAETPIQAETATLTYVKTYGKSGYSTDTRYDVQLELKDKKQTVTAIGILPPAYYVMDVSTDGTQLAFGSAATRAGLEVAMPLILTAGGASSRIVPIRLRSGAWASGKKQTIAIPGLDASTAVRIIASPFSTTAELTALTVAKLTGSQAANALTITASGTQPTIDVYIVAKEIL